MQQRAERPWRQRVRDVFIFTVGVVLPIVPVTMHNRVTGGEWVLISTQGGTNFFIGNNPVADGKTAVAFAPQTWEKHREYVDNVWWASRANAEALSGQQLSDSEVSRFWFKRGFRFWRNQPLAALKLTLRKGYYLLNGFEIESNRSMYLDRLWSPIATILLSSEQAIVAYPFGILGPLALIGLCLRGRGRSLAGLLRWVILCYAVLIVAFFVNGRFRVPLTPLLALFAADAVLRLIDAARAGKYMTLRIGFFVLVGLLVLCNSTLLDVRDIDYVRQAGIIGGAYRESGQVHKALAYLEEAADKASPDNVGDLEEAGDVGAVHVVARRAVFFGGLVRQFSWMLIMMLCRRSSTSSRVQLRRSEFWRHFEAGNRDAAGVGSLAGAVEDLALEEDVDRLGSRRHVRALGDAVAAVLDQVVGVFDVDLVLGGAGQGNVALDLPEGLNDAPAGLSWYLALGYFSVYSRCGRGLTFLRFMTNASFSLSMPSSIDDEAAGIGEGQHLGAQFEKLLAAAYWATLPEPETTTGLAFKGSRRS